MKHGLPLLLIVAVLAGSLALPQSNPPHGKKNTVAKKTASSKKGKTAKRPPVATVASRNRQMAPTPERYKEIQQALADKGYLTSEPNGVWDAQSSDALLRFQTDKKLSPTGKLSSASLISLGLGPKAPDTAVVPPPAPAETPRAPTREN
jgi:hypothetical protein